MRRRKSPFKFYYSDNSLKDSSDKYKLAKIFAGQVPGYLLRICIAAFARPEKPGQIPAHTAVPHAAWRQSPLLPRAQAP
jgi:hypothetical protein